MAFVKYRFTSKNNGNTAGLVLDTSKHKRTSVTELSRAFPYSESAKMERLEISPEYETWEEAFHHEFE
jgi:hypothetical protein